MFSYFVIILIKSLILTQINKSETLFVSAPDYSKEGIPGLNLPECGLSLAPIINHLNFGRNKCFQNSYKDRTLLNFETKQITSERLFLGKDVKLGEAPWVVYLYDTRLQFDSLHCTGSLITPYWVITAAHCLEDWKDFLFSGDTIHLSMGPIRTEGILKREISKEDFFSHKIFLDPGSYFNREVSTERKNEIKYQHDIGLIRLREPIEQEVTNDRKYSINTICLPKSDQTDVKRDERATFYGFGQMSRQFLFFRNLPTKLQVGWVVMRRFGECGSMTQFCGWFAGDDPRPCQGDSGGPMVQFMERSNVKKAVLIGTLVSAGNIHNNATDCTRQITQAHWMAVPKFINWILKTIKENQLNTTL